MSYACDHTHTEVRRLVCANGAIQFKRQCVRCGMSSGSALRHSEVMEPVPPWDSQLRETFIRDAAMQASIERADRQEREAREWRQKHNAALASAHWVNLRERVLKRDGYQCQGCLSKGATEVHHLTYERLGRELAIDLVSLCAACHTAIHNKGEQEAAA